MKKIIISCLMIGLQASVQAQIGIGTANPNPSAALDVAATDKGLLVPRLTAAQRTGLANPATGLLVIQTDEAAGFYYNAGTPAAPNWLNLSSYTLQQNINTNGKFISGDGSNAGIQVAPDGMVTASGTFTGINLARRIPEGSQMLWMPHKAAFKAGRILNSHIFQDFVGLYSVAMGYNPMATAEGSVAIGTATRASGYRSFALGSNVSTNNFNGSFILGDGTNNSPSLNSAQNQFLARFEGGFQFYAVQQNIPALSISNHSVGIGKSSPTQALDVNGNITYSGQLMMGVQYVKKEYTVGGNGRADYNCGCPQGTKLIGGGGGHRDWNGAVNDIEIAYSGPHADNNNFWRIMLQNTSGSSRAITIWAICARVQ